MKTQDIKKLNLNQLAELVHENAVNHGFHPENQAIRDFMANQCNNLHGEVTELWDAWRAGKDGDLCDKCEKMIDLGLMALTTTEEEIADIIIRALDLAGRLGIDIAACVESKHKYNVTRPILHGKLN